MKLQKLFEVQMERNKTLKVLPNLDEYKLNARKFLALNVRVSALANATKCFKYWQDDESVNTEYALSKYINTLSCILTIGLDKGYGDIEQVRFKVNEYCLSDQFLNLYVDINDLLMSSSRDHYITLLEDFLSIGLSIGYSEEDIILNYMKKC